MATDGLDGIRRLLIRVGKVLPFVVCALVLTSYTESVYALFNENFLYYEGCYVLSKPIANYIGSIFEYNIQTLFVLTLTSIAIRTCVYNKLACAYLGFNLLEKSYLDFELEPTTIYIICIINIVITSFLCYKGVKRLFS